MTETRYEIDERDDLEAGGGDTYMMGPHQSKQIRQEFVSKVFSLVGMMFGFTALISCSVTFYADKMLKREELNSIEPFGVGLIISGLIATIIFHIIYRCTSMVKSTGGGYGLMALATASYTSFVAGLGIVYVVKNDAADIIYQAFAATTLITLGLGLFAKYTKYDVTGMGMYVAGAMMAMFIIGIFQVILMIVLGSYALNWLHIGIECVGIIVICFCMVYEIQLILGGEERLHAISVDDYAIAAIELYLSMIVLLLRIMNVLMRMRR